jgi:hypothetical protein
MEEDTSAMKKSIRNFTTYDRGNADELFVGVGIENGLVAVVLSLKTDGDITVFLDIPAATELANALIDAANQSALECPPRETT